MDIAQDGIYKLEMSQGSVIRYDGKCDTKNRKFIEIIKDEIGKIKIKILSNRKKHSLETNN